MPEANTHAPTVLALLTATLAAGAAAQDVTFIEGLGEMAFVTVGDPGNRGIRDSDLDYGIPAGRNPFYRREGWLGQVGDPYRISRSPITYGDWHPFLESFSQVSSSLPFAPLVGTFGQTVADPTRPGGWRPVDPAVFGTANHGISVNIEYAAMYVNWLHNDRATTAAAFEQGVYDTTTFYDEEVNGETVRRHDFTPADDARFWLPDMNEMLKAAYFDPFSTAPNGDEGRWWHFGNQTDDPLVPGPPGEGERIGEIAAPGFAPTGQYPDTQSAYGLLDLHGIAFQAAVPRGLLAEGGGFLLGDQAGQIEILHSVRGHLGIGPAPRELFTPSAFRIAAAVPAPPSAPLIASVLMLAARRRRSLPPRHAAHRQIAVLRP